jgi:predicted RNase H-like HicB family nuclease
MREYAVIFEPAESGSNWSAYAPDVPGCVATGKTLDECRIQFKEALEFHFEGMRQDGLPIPEPTTVAEYVKVEIGQA